MHYLFSLDNVIYFSTDVGACYPHGVHKTVLATCEQNYELGNMVLSMVDSVLSCVFSNFVTVVVRKGVSTALPGFVNVCIVASWQLVGE